MPFAARKPKKPRILRIRPKKAPCNFGMLVEPTKIEFGKSMQNLNRVPLLDVNVQPDVRFFLGDKKMPDAKPVIDIESLLKPIPGENPCGENLRYAGLYDDIANAKRSHVDLDILAEEQSDWGKVISLSVEALATRTKDLLVAAWLGEALVKKYGFPGLNDSLKLMSGMHSLFWDNFYPEIDEGDLEARVNYMAWYDRQISAEIKEIPLTNVPKTSNLSFLQWQESSLPEEIQLIALSNPEEAAAIKENCEKAAGEWARLTQDTPLEFYEELKSVLQQCLKGYAELDHWMYEKLEQLTPGLRELKWALEDIQGLVGRVLKEKGASDA